MNRPSFLSHRHIVSIDQFSREDLELLFRRAEILEIDPLSIADGRYNRKILGSVFLESSTRTRLSFESAMNRLGGRVIQIPEYKHLALSKGESEEDSIRVISGYTDILLARCPDSETLLRLCENSVVPIINGGDGSNEHPTQSLLDLYSIQKEKGKIDGLKIVVAGDLKWARVAHSLLKGLQKFDVEVVLVSPSELRTPIELLEKCRLGGARFSEEEDLDKAIHDADVLYIMMLQHHRIQDAVLLERLRKEYPSVNAPLIQKCKPSLVILHPLVRQQEVSSEVDQLPQAAYFRQAQNGVPLRMALLSYLLDG